MNDLNKNRLNILLGYIVLIIVGTVTSVTGIYLIKRIKIPQQEQIVVQPEIKPSQYPDYDVIKGQKPDQKVKAIKLTADCPGNGCINDKPASIDLDGIEKTYFVKGEFSRAYLYIEAAVDYTRPLTRWDDFYFQFDSWGGHLLTNENLLPTPPGDISRYLYDLRSVSYFLTDMRGRVETFENINFFALLQNGTVADMRAAISSDRPGRVLKEASIYYECLENSECSIDERK